ncbi:MAG: rRNA maturation RNase YbeY [Gemmatimonadaceae bacterium]
MSRTGAHATGPRLAVDVSAEDVRVPLGRQAVAELARAVLAAERVRDALLSITFVSSRAIAQLNRRYLARRGPTDVIAFGFRRPSASAAIIGDIYIAPHIAREQAANHGAGVREELARLVVHGILHVLGNDHPDGDERSVSPMWRKQELLLARLHPGSADTSTALRSR